MMGDRSGASEACGPAARRAAARLRDALHPNRVTTWRAHAGRLAASTERRNPMATESGDTPLLDLLASMTASSVESTNLDPKSLMLVRIAALVAVDAPPASYTLNLGVAGELGVTADEVEGLLAGVAPIVGTTRIVSAVGKLVRALNLKIELGELEQYIEG
jgi:alkylhydroperoxidase/carboxymuconolactone decarboxylase family protein YurZ